jgi:hypothetical protein
MNPGSDTLLLSNEEDAMPRKKAAAISFGKSATTPSKRNGVKEPKSAKMPMNKPKGQRTITDFVEEARENDVSTREAIEQFQEVECTHGRQWVEIAHSPTKRLVQCPGCGKIEDRVVKPR